jgi:ParB-like chromosome segregation protein Spo0J
MPEGFDIEKAEAILPAERYTNLREFIETATPDVIRTAYFHIPTEWFYEAENIRPYNPQQIADLAESIRAEGQLQAGIADLCINDDGTFQLRIIAGKHRKKAIEKINFEKEPGEPITLFEVRLYDKQLTARQIVNIQMAENLQEKMTPAQDAAVIESMWKEYMVNIEHEEEMPNIKEFAAQISRRVDVVKDAIVYIDKIDENVQKLVDAKIIPYTMALLLSGISKEKKGFGSLIS